MAAKLPGRNERQKQAMIRIVIMAFILIGVNILASYFHSGIDLTKEKRFTLSEPTRNMLKNMQEVAVVDVYMQGKFPAGLQRLEEAVRERLRSFQDVAGKKIVVRYTNPLEGRNDAEKKQMEQDLAKKGIKKMELQTTGEEEMSLKYFFPYALVQYNGREMLIMLLENPTGKNTPEEKISYAETILEYKFADAINQMGRRDVAHLAYITGNGEPLGITSYDLLHTLGRHYWVDTVDINRSSEISLAYDAIVIVQPTIAFSGPQQLKIDQYIMKGGHMLLSLNTLNASLDSLAHSPQFIAMENPLQLDEMLYKYGARVNADLVQDMQNLRLGRTMNDGQPMLFDWIYFPRLNPIADHPIVRNMDFVRAGFTNSIDTINAPGIRKTVLLQTSKYSLKASAPARVSLSMMTFKPREAMFNKSYLPVAVLLEGKFRSAFENKLDPAYLRLLNDTLKQSYKAACDSDNHIIITSVGDIFLNTYSTKEGVLPMGYYRWTDEYYANRDFLLNCLEYLTDRSNILEARSKEVKLRLLDKGRIKDEKGMWEFVNVAIPLAAVLVFASAYLFFRKRKFETKLTHTSTKHA